MRSYAACAAVFLAAACAGDAPVNPHLVITADTIELRRADDGSTIVVYTGDAMPSDSTTQPVLGRLETRGSTLRFVSRFPAVPGQQYFVRANARGLVIDTTFTLPQLQTEPTTNVEAIYPSTDVVPMNLLRIYVQFSAPMRMGEAQHRIALIDDQGNEVRDAFLVPPQELWDAGKQRLTMLFDPGRIKRGIRPNEELGLPLQAGKSYRIVVDSAWRDAYGNPLKSSYVKPYTVTAADRNLPRVADWNVSPPTGTAPLTIDFPEALDHALLLRLITVRGVSGHSTLERNERRWTFHADQPWKAGVHIIDVSTDLEDLAGNSLRDVFDLDRKAPQRGDKNAVVQIRFTVK